MAEEYSFSVDSLADLASGLSGLGPTLENGTSELGAYNMSDVLELPMFKTEDPLNFGDLDNLDNGLHYTLMAPTSPASKLGEETITYLNKSQTYELKFKALGDRAHYQSGLLRILFRVCFSDMRLRKAEPGLWEAWQGEHADMRTLNVEAGRNVKNVREMPQVNTLSVDWDSTKEGTVFIKVNCLSTEFTAKKHGGEKGVHLLLEADAYRQESPSDAFHLFHSAVCQIKVFKDKGADRKLRQDMQKYASQTEEERQVFAPSYQCTILQDFCTEICGAEPTLMSDAMFEIHAQQTALQTPAASSTSIFQLGEPLGVRGSETPGAYSNSTIASSAEASPYSVSSLPSFTASTPSPGNSGSQNSIALPLTVDSSIEDTHQWLASNGFGMHRVIFSNFSGVDILKLSRDDMKELLGEAEGIRLNNALKSRSVCPLLTFYIVLPEETFYRGVFLHSASIKELQERLAGHCGILSHQLTAIHKETLAGFTVLVDSQVLWSIKPEATFGMRLVSDGSTGANGLPNYMGVLKEM